MKKSASLRIGHSGATGGAGFCRAVTKPARVERAALTVKQNIDIVTWRDQIDTKIQELHVSANQTHQASADAGSAALDPFTINVNIDCKGPGPKPPNSKKK